MTKNRARARQERALERRRVNLERYERGDYERASHPGDVALATVKSDIVNLERKLSTS